MPELTRHPFFRFIRGIGDSTTLVNYLNTTLFFGGDCYTLPVPILNSYSRTKCIGR
jgi:hypothetical protein